MEYPKLKEKLDTLLLLDEEKKMWLRAGFYVANSGTTTGVILIDSEGSQETLYTSVARNLRKAVIDWWQVERVKPRASEPIDDTGLSSLENRNVESAR